MFDVWPLAIEDREPGRVSVAALDDQVLAKDALVLEPKAFGGFPRAFVIRIALPFHAAAVHGSKGFAQHKVDGLCVRSPALPVGRVPDVAQFKAARG